MVHLSEEKKGYGSRLLSIQIYLVIADIPFCVHVAWPLSALFIIGSLLLIDWLN